jgi:hypothetical protein
MRPDAFSQPPYEQALELLRNAGESLPEGIPGDPRWTTSLVQGLVQLAERARASAPGGVTGDAGFDVGPPFAGEVSADERAMLFVPAPDATQEPLS